MVEMIHEAIKYVVLGIEVLAALVIVSAIISLAVKPGTIRYLFQHGEQGAYENYKHQLAKSLLLALELLVAADVVRTIALEPTLYNVAVLGLLVIIRTFLSWSMVVEIKGRWPWQAETAGRTKG